MRTDGELKVATGVLAPDSDGAGVVVTPTSMKVGVLKPTGVLSDTLVADDVIVAIAQLGVRTTVGTVSGALGVLDPEGGIVQLCWRTTAGAFGTGVLAPDRGAVVPATPLVKHW